jgi:hypothetical protein
MPDFNQIFDDYEACASRWERGSGIVKVHPIGILGGKSM